MPTPNLTFCWNGLISKDPAATTAFMTHTVGWTAEEMQMGDDSVVMFREGDTTVAHIREPAMEQEPSWWNAYLRVPDVDAAAAAVAAHGGQIVVPPTDIMPGRFSTVATPSGAFFTLFTDAEGADPEEGQGQVHWVDLHSKDVDGDLAFLCDVLGFETSEMDIGSGPYHLLMVGEESRGGLMAGVNPAAPSMWCAWVKVDDVDAAVARGVSRGGTSLGPAWDGQGVGRMAIIQDPAGIVFGLVTPPAS